MWRVPANAFVRILLAPSCAACRTELTEPLNSPVCSRCWSLVAPVPAPACTTCGDALPPLAFDQSTCSRCRTVPPPYARAVSAGRYDDALREVIHVFKYDGRRLLAEPLGRLMRTAGADLLTDADAAIPVPLHPIRALQRGFNQADDLARQLGLPVWRALRRRRHGPPQASLAARQRQANLNTAFALSRSWTIGARLRQHTLRDRVVVIVDDVMTTGATVEACSDVLLAAGVRSVRVLTAARAVAGPRPRQPPPPLPSTPSRR